MTDIMISPKCKCHGVEMFLHKRKDGRSDVWECKIKKSKSNKKYLKTAKGQEVNRRGTKKYKSTAHGFLREYLTDRERDLKMLKEKTEKQLSDIQSEIKELELVIK